MSAVITERYDFSKTGGGTGRHVTVAGYSVASVSDYADAYRPVELCETTLTRAEARAFAVALLANLDEVEAS